MIVELKTGNGIYGISMNSRDYFSATHYLLSGLDSGKQFEELNLGLDEKYNLGSTEAIFFIDSLIIKGLIEVKKDGFSISKTGKSHLINLDKIVDGMQTR
jgi:hypothetical protein